jgi:APA family basic amino acid/polyamine antiporter
MQPALRREMGLGGAIVTGLGSILGTGAFVAIGIAAGMWGDAVILAIPIAGGLAMFNGLSSAFLAGRFPVAGGTYEYAYRSLGPWWGFIAGWLFLLAKTASAGAAALGVATYLGITEDKRIVAIGAILAVTGFVVAGLRPSILVNVVLVAITITALVAFGVSGLAESGPLSPIPRAELGAGLLPAIAFVFVAYTGYGRIATLGEEVRRPERFIPRAVVVTLVIAGALYMLVALGGRALGGPDWGVVLDEAGLDALLDEPLSVLVAIGAVTAMLGVLLNLILGLSRVWLAMGRRGDMPMALARLDQRQNPLNAVLAGAVPVILFALIGEISVAWSFSAFTVLLYYGITNLAALATDSRRWTSWAGLITCVSLSFFVPLAIWLTGATLIALGSIWKSQRRD